MAAGPSVHLGDLGSRALGLLGQPRRPVPRLSADVGGRRDARPSPEEDEPPSSGRPFGLSIPLAFHAALDYTPPAMYALGAVTILLIVLVAGCASQVEIKTPLPPDIGNPLPPQRDLPEQMAAFVGVWTGKWHEWVHLLAAGNVGTDETLVVQNIMPLTDSTYKVYVIRSWGIAPGNPSQRPGFSRGSGMIGEDGILRMEPTRSGAIITFTMAENRQTLHVEYRSVSFRMTGTLWRTKLP